MLRKVKDWIDVDPGDLRSIIGDTSETENEKEMDEGKTRNMVRKTPTTPKLIIIKRKDPFVSSSGLSAHPFVERPKVAVNGTQAENVHRVEWTMAKWHESEKDIERIVMIEEDLCS